MSAHDIYDQLGRDFEQLLHFIERAIESPATSEIELAKLRRAKTAAEKGVALARSAISASRSPSA